MTQQLLSGGLSAGNENANSKPHHTPVPPAALVTVATRRKPPRRPRAGERTRKRRHVCTTECDSAVKKEVSPWATAGTDPEGVGLREQVRERGGQTPYGFTHTRNLEIKANKERKRPNVALLAKTTFRPPSPPCRRGARGTDPPIKCTPRLTLDGQKAKKKKKKGLIFF